MESMDMDRYSEAWTRILPAALLAIAVGALGTAYTAQYKYDLEPCILCLYQRAPYAVIGILGIFGFLARSPKFTIPITAIAALTFLIGAGIAFYHVGVEQHWWASAGSCGSTDAGPNLNVDQLQALLQQKPEKACDEVDWTLFGVSMATYNAAVSAILALAGAFAVIRLRRSA